MAIRNFNTAAPAKSAGYFETGGSSAVPFIEEAKPDLVISAKKSMGNSVLDGLIGVKDKLVGDFKKEVQNEAGQGARDAVAPWLIAVVVIALIAVAIAAFRK